MTSPPALSEFDEALADGDDPCMLCGDPVVEGAQAGQDVVCRRCVTAHSPVFEAAHVSRRRRVG